MSLGGGGGGSTTTVQKADPWVGLQGPLNTLYGGATANYGTGGPQYYPGSTVAPTNWPIEASLNAGQARATSDPYAGMMGTAQNTLNSTAAGRSPWENPGFGTTNNFAAGSYVGTNPAQSGLQQFASGANAGTNPAQSYFQSSTNGSYLDKQNPYLSGLVNSASRPVVQNFQNAIAPSLASQFSAAGRMGSGAQNAAFGTAADTLGRNLGDISTNIYGTAYENERQRQQAAASQLSGMNQFDRTQQMQGLQSSAQLNANERAQQLQAAGASSDMYQQAQNRQQQAALAAPGFAQSGQALDFSRIAQLMGVGQYQQQQQQQQIDANKARFDFNQNRPNMNLEQLNQILNGGMQLNGSTTNGSTKQNANPFAAGLGGAAIGSSIVNNGLFGLIPGAISGGTGALLGGLGGLLFG